MTPLEWMSAWWRKLPPVPERRITIAPTPKRETRVPAEYLPLYTYLERRYATTVVLTFEQLEVMLGFPLPGAARVERDWWTGAAVRAASHSAAWTVAQRTATPNLSAHNVAFERVS